MTSAKTNGRLRGVLIGLLCSLITILLLFSIYLVRYRYFLSGLQGYEEMTSADYEPPVFPKLSDREVTNLGWAHSESRHPDSSYINFPAEKRPGTVRIGTFGDSNTAGSEAAANHDYPSFLQRRFEKAGYDHVEVINFGVGSYGVHQSYLMWKTLGEKYDLDVVVLLPFSFHTRRDGSFIKRPRYFAGVHARYVLSDGGLELIEVLGENRLEASLRYYGLFPAQRYLRYDRIPPPFLRALIPKGRKLNINPFYYAREMSTLEESLASYSILFERWAEETASLVITTVPGHFYERIEKISTRPGIFRLASHINAEPGSTLYRAPDSHPSALGNHLRAEELFAFLTGREKPEPHVLRIRGATRAEPKTGLSFGPLSRYASVSVNILEAPVATFVLNRRNEEPNRLGDILDFSENGTASLLEAPGAYLPFVPLPFPLTDGAPVSLTFELDGEPVEVPVGTVEASSEILGRIVLEGTDANGALVKEGAGWSLEMNGRDYLEPFAIDSEKTIRSPRLLIGEQTAFVGKRKRSDERKEERPGKIYRFRSVEGRLAYLRGKAGQFVDPDLLDERSGGLELVMEDEDGQRVRHPLSLAYEVTVREVRPFEKPYRHAISRIAVREAP